MYILYMKNIFTYINFTEYLNDWVAWRKSNEPNFSYQVLANELGVQSKSYMQNVIKGISVFSEESMKKIIVLMKLSSKEKLYFESLVAFKQSKTLNKKNNLWKEIKKQYVGQDDLKSIEFVKAEFDYLSHWYIPVVKEIITDNKIEGNIDKIARLLIPQINAAQVKFAIKVLTKLNLINVNAEGVVKNKSPYMLIQSEVNSLAIRNFQKENIELAKESLNNIAKTDRDVSTLVMGTTHVGYEKIKTLIQQFQEDVAAVIEKEADVEQVYVLNIQLIPKSKLINKEKLS